MVKIIICNSWGDKMIQLMVDKTKKVSRIVFIDMLFESEEGEVMEEDADFLREIEEAYQLHDEGKFHHMSADEFLKELRKW